MFEGARAQSAARALIAGAGEAAATETAGAAAGSALAEGAGTSIGLTVAAPAAVAAAGAGLVYIYSRPGVMEETIARIHGIFNPEARQTWELVTRAQHGDRLRQLIIGDPKAVDGSQPILEPPSGERIAIGESPSTGPDGLQLPTIPGATGAFELPGIPGGETLEMGPAVFPTRTPTPTPPQPRWDEDRIAETMVETGNELPTLGKQVDRGDTTGETRVRYGELLVEYNRLDHKPDMPTEEEVRALRTQVEALKSRVYSPRPEVTHDQPPRPRHTDTPIPLRPEFNNVEVTPRMRDTMSRIASRNRDITYPEMRGFLEDLGYETNNGNGSVRTFSRPHSPPITIHQPHGGEPFMKTYVLQNVERALRGGQR